MGEVDDGSCAASWYEGSAALIWWETRTAFAALLLKRDRWDRAAMLGGRELDEVALLGGTTAAMLRCRVKEVDEGCTARWERCCWVVRRLRC